MKLRRLKQIIKEEIKRIKEQGAGPRPYGPPGASARMGRKRPGRRPSAGGVSGTCPEARDPWGSIYRALGSPSNWSQFITAYRSFYQKASQYPGLNLKSPNEVAQRIDVGKVPPTPTPQGIPPLIIFAAGAGAGSAVTGFVCWFFGGAFDW